MSKKYTDAAMETLVKSAAQYLLAHEKGDKAGAAAELAKAKVISNNPKARKR
ncbi:hypothetical protein OG884_15365 [Streptosporangium sp. NBC_01755]|uniref:hypothetical protein n=1 Tax=unclassified Streptosporangium TaxID=2632669 RepID=UPI002DD82C50|nr:MULTISPECIES: hypothetical protein [unclassified Streptosporangium]WSA27387.1 hypothetical protein OIE13_05805 [Streptosporangium sp. NBC_01810]WSD03212.1 hypothetical protein OG884_15365 [Streptosporangium sp. NBC_01755]